MAIEPEYGGTLKRRQRMSVSDIDIYLTANVGLGSGL